MARLAVAPSWRHGAVVERPVLTPETDIRSKFRFDLLQALELPPVSAYSAGSVVASHRYPYSSGTVPATGSGDDHHAKLAARLRYTPPATQLGRGTRSALTFNLDQSPEAGQFSEERMARTNLFTEDEIVLCTYLARFGRDKFDELSIHNWCSRSLDSIRMKVRNIVTMLDEEGYQFSSKVAPLSGRPHGETGRRTNWNVVSRLVQLSETAHYAKCVRILGAEC